MSQPVAPLTRPPLSECHPLQGYLDDLALMPEAFAAETDPPIQPIPGNRRDKVCR